MNQLTPYRALYVFDDRAKARRFLDDHSSIATVLHGFEKLVYQSGAEVYVSTVKTKDDAYRHAGQEFNTVVFMGEFSSFITDYLRCRERLQ